MNQYWWHNLKARTHERFDRTFRKKHWMKEIDDSIQYDVDQFKSNIEGQK